MIDLRSDTITTPTDAMRQAMFEAEVGDDVMHEDPATKQLENEVAALLGKEAALFVPSGTMGNQLGVRAQTSPGDEIVLEAEAHMYYYEVGATAALSGVLCRTLPGQRGLFTAEQVAVVIRPDDVHHPQSRMVCIENTSNRGGGSVWSLDRIAEIAAVARTHGLIMHMDGARLWNAAVAAGVTERAYADHFDSISVCFSKGLGAPVGSALVGTAEMIARARRFRKQFGGGMRQSGVVAAAALYALRNHRKRLADDHVNAKKLADAIAGFAPIEVSTDHVESNIIRFETKMPAAAFVKELRRRDVAMLNSGPHVVRAVTNMTVSSDDIDAAISAVGEVCQQQQVA